MLDTKEKPVEGKVTEPSRQWRNRFRHLAPVPFVNGVTLGTGDHWGFNIFPSKDAAETRAAQWIATQPSPLRGDVEYLGAFPVTP